MALSKEEILDAIAEMSVIDIVDLIEAMEEKFGVSAAAPVAAAAPVVAGGDAGGEAEADDAPVDIHLSEVGDKKVDVIKAVRACLLYTSPSPRDATLSRMPSSA